MGHLVLEGLEDELTQGGLVHLGGRRRRRRRGADLVLGAKLLARFTIDQGLDELGGVEANQQGAFCLVVSDQCTNLLDVSEDLALGQVSSLDGNLQGNNNELTDGADSVIRGNGPLLPVLEMKKS